MSRKRTPSVRRHAIPRVAVALRSDAPAVVGLVLVLLVLLILRSTGAP